jgi:hypothetical protein
MSNLLLFGAGASFGSQYDNAPPLGVDLFDRLVTINPDGWGKVDNDIASVFREDFEAGMERLFEAEPVMVSVLQRTMAYYLHSFMPTRDSLYYRLARRIRKGSWHGTIATLNYDFLLQRSLLGAGVNWHIGKAPDDSSMEICLPHGSCNLFVDGVTVCGSTHFNADINGPVSLIDDTMHFATRLMTNTVPPIMCYYEATKKATSGSEFIIEQRNRLQCLIENASRIAIVGVRVHPTDSHIWSALSSTGGEILYCGGHSGRLEYDEWKRANRPDAEDTAVDGYFDDEFGVICRHVYI